jgi:hypothetical protein
MHALSYFLEPWISNISQIKMMHVCGIFFYNFFAGTQRTYRQVCKKWIKCNRPSDTLVPKTRYLYKVWCGIRYMETHLLAATLFFKMSLVGTSSVEWCSKRSFPHKDDSGLLSNSQGSLRLVPFPRSSNNLQ